MDNVEFIPGTMNFSLVNGLAIYKGSTWKIPVTVAGPCGEKVYPIDISGFTGRCEIKETASATVIAKPTVIIEDGLQGIFSLNLTDEETMAIKTDGETFRDVSTFQYDVYFDGEDGKAYRVLMGYVDVSPNITGVN